MKRRLFYPGAALVAVLAAATVFAGLAPGPEDRSPGREHDGRVVVRILSYNVQNLFDGTDHGGEYPEFRASSGWNRADYYERLERVGETVRRTAGGRLPEIVVLCEVESASVAADLARDFLRRYRWVSGPPEPGRAPEPRRTPQRREAHEPPGADPGPGAPVGRLRAPAYPPPATRVAVLSRSRPDLRSHRAAEIDLVPGAGARVRWRGRETVELRFASRGLRLFAAHWKSQSGGERATEPKRILEAALVHDLLVATASLQTDFPVTLLAGDLNEDLHEERQHAGSWPTALVPWRPPGTTAESERAAPHPAARIRFVEGSAGPALAASGGPVFRTLWAGVDAPGTYWYRGEWERLDHAFLLAPAAYDGRIEVGSWEALLESDGTPARYDARRGRGYSDHLPILVTVTRRQGP